VKKLTKTTIKYINLLNNKSIEDNSIILSDLSNINIKREDEIKFKCNCEIEDKKVIRQILEKTGFFCKLCISKNRTYKKRITKKRINTKLIDLLKNKSIEDKALILSELNYIKRSDEIKFKCNCGNEYKKKVKYIIERTDFYCNICTINLSRQKHKNCINRNKKYIKLLIEKSIEDKALIITKLINIFRENRINFKCNCGNKYTKSTRDIIEKTGFYCEKCTLYVKNQKSKKTCNERYGCDNPMQNPEIYKNFSSIAYSSKDYIFNSGEKVRVQGYEPFALDLLQKQGYCFEDIKIEGVKIKYNFDNKKKIYTPDIYIPKENIIIEVKSKWTYELHLKQNIQKQNACISEGFNFEFWFFDDKGNKITL